MALIPARLASTRLPRKPLADLAGKPMVIRVAECARASGATRVAIATDSGEIADVARDHGVEVVLTANHHATGTDRLAEAALTLELSDDTIVANVQGDEPLMPPALIARVCALLGHRPECAIATAAHPIEDIADFLSPHVVKLAVSRAGEALYFSRAPIPFPRDAFAGFPYTLPESLPGTSGAPSAPGLFPILRHIGLYAYRAGFLRTYRTLSPSPLESVESLEQLRALWHGYRIAVEPSESAPPAGVDTPADLERVRAVLARTANPGASARS